MTKKSRVAVCISGQIRTLGEKLGEIAEQARRIDADVFISVWRERGGKTLESGPRHSAMTRIFGDSVILLPRNWCYKLEYLLPDWQKIIPERPPVSEAELRAFFPDAIIEIEDDLPELDFPADKNSLRMLYKINRCNRLKQDFESQNGFKYDQVIRVRPDMLVDFECFNVQGLAPNDLLIFLRRGTSAHDKYWAGSTETDNIMAGLYDYARECRLENWTGIHHELTEYIKINGLNPLHINCNKQDFRDFGQYSKQEFCAISQNFIDRLSRLDLADKAPEEQVFVKIGLEVMKLGNASICDGALIEPGIGLIDQLESLLKGAAESNIAWNLLPVVSIVFACDLSISHKDRAILAYSVLLDDALTWKSWYAIRTAYLSTLLPESGTELISHLRCPGEMLDYTSDDAVTKRILALWGSRVAGFEQADVLRAQSDITKNFLNSRHLRWAMSEHFRKEKRFLDLQDFAELVVSYCSEQKNAHVFLAQAKRMVAENTPS